MYCSKCGKEINEDAVICVYCGCPTAKFDEKSKEKEKEAQPIIINNNNSTSSSAAAAAAASSGRIRRKHSLLLDILLIFLTGGLWIIWMIFRPKYY